jgi:hypothetical protein
MLVRRIAILANRYPFVNTFYSIMKELFASAAAR